MARTKAYKTAADLEKAINAYFEDCERKMVFADYAGMKIFLGVSDKTLSRYSENADYADVLEVARDRRESYLQRKMVTDNKLAQGCLNALKQPCNGGWVDKPVDSGERTIRVILDGMPAGIEVKK